MPNWSKKRGQLQAYLAGIADGEGCFAIYHLGDSYGGRFSITMQDPQALLYFKLLYPGGTLRKRGLEYSLVYSQFHAYEVTKELLPFLMVKREQAQVLLSFLVHRRRDHQKKAANGCGHCVRCDYFVSTIKSLRRKDLKGVNSVNALLTTELREYRAKREEVEQDVDAFLALLEGVETRDRVPQPVEPTSAPEQEIVHSAA